MGKSKKDSVDAEVSLSDKIKALARKFNIPESKFVEPPINIDPKPKQLKE